MQTEIINQLNKLLSELFLSENLTLHFDFDSKTTCYVPYMMNDAMEYYIVFYGCRVVGAYGENNKIDGFKLISDEQGVIFTKEDDSVFTLWFESVSVECKLFKYDHLGHFWNRDGHEQWRRLNYIIGTAFDKYSYVGDDACNDCEKEMMTLLGVVPFRKFTPIDEEFDVFYNPADLKKLELPGILVMSKLAVKSGCNELKALLDAYHSVCVKINKSRVNRFFLKFRYSKICKEIHEFLKTEKSFPIYSFILKTLDEGLKYPDRKYDEKCEREFAEKRSAVDKMLKTQGYEGGYPIYAKGKEAIHCIEEKPYTVAELEYDGFGFHIYGMKCTCENPLSNPDAGFFGKNGNKAKIVNLI